MVDVHIITNRSRHLYQREWIEKDHVFGGLRSTPTADLHLIADVFSRFADARRPVVYDKMDQG